MSAAGIGSTAGGAARPWRALIPGLIALLVASGPTPAGARDPQPPPLTPPALAAGQPLAEALRELQRQGLRLVFSSQVVGPELRVAATPRSADPRSRLDELLAPHGLAAREEAGGTLIVVVAPAGASTAQLVGSVRSRRALAPVAGAWVRVLEAGVEAATDEEGRFEIRDLAPGSYTLQARRPGYVVEEREGVVGPAGARSEVAFLLQPAPLTAEEIVVHPSRLSLLQEEPAAALALGREELLALPHLGGDVFRALGLLPGIAANDVSAQFHVRGGRRDEILILLDGQEIYDAYHLKDFDNALSVVAATALASLDLTTGAFPASFGDRMGGVLDMSTVTPSRPSQLRFALGVFDAQLESGGRLGERTSWLASARRGASDLVADLFDKPENPRFWDLFGKLDHRLSPARSLRMNFLRAHDRLDFFELVTPAEQKRLNTEYDSAYFWLTHQAVLTDRLFVDSALSTSRSDRDRRGFELDEDRRFEVQDERELEVLGALQSWSFQAAPRSYFQAGFELRRFEADYDYRSFREFDTPLAELRSAPRTGRFDHRDQVVDDAVAAYLTNRLRPLPVLTLEVGARFDRHSLTGAGVWSPRASAAWALGRTSVVRLGWGLYHQSQRAYELGVEDGDTRFYPDERSEQWVLGFERRLGGAGALPLTALRIEAYRRRVSDPRPRYESLFEPLEPFPEGELDRQRIDPERGRAEGVELFLRGRAGERVDWWVTYAWAEADDEVSGGAVPRLVDQRHTVNVDLQWRLGRGWDLNLAWRYHTGWPTTPIRVETTVDEEGEAEPVPVLGPIGSERLPDYHRLDLRLGRRWDLARGRLHLFFDVQNLYGRENVAGYDISLDADTFELEAVEEPWPGFFASAGLAWEF